MTDGQSEANQYIDTSHPSLRQTPQERITQHRERYEQLKKNARYGVPPWTVDDCRFVLWLLDGELVGQRKRCEACNGTGEVTWCEYVNLSNWKTKCALCDGTGYVG